MYNVENDRSKTATVSNNDKTIIIVVVLILSVIAVGIMYAYHTAELNKLNKQPIKTVVKTVYKEKIISKEGLIIDITIKDLEDDLKRTIKHLSTAQRKRIIDSIVLVSKKYEVSPIILYSLIYVESTFRPWIRSAERTVNNYDGKSVKDRAIGLGSIMYSIWGKLLKENNIIETKSDLYEIENNIAAIGYIFNRYKGQKLKKGTTDSTTSAMRRYFGGNYKGYSKKIKDKIGKILFYKLL